VPGLKRILVIILIWIISNQTIAQEMHGFVNSNYAGITGSLINPTSILNSKLYIDIAPLGLHFNVDNNYIYLASEEYKFSRFFSSTDEFPKHGPDDRVFYDNYNTDLKNAYSQTRILGPSAMISLDRHAFGLSTAVRTIVSGRTIPYELAKFAVEGIDYQPLHDINFIDEHNFRSAGIAFAEIAGTYSTVVYNRNRDHFTAGITIKGLFGSGGGYGFVDNIDYYVPNSDTMIFRNINGSMGVSLPVDPYTNDVLLSDKLFIGSGLGVDIGFTYQKKILGHSNKGYSMPCEYPYEPYRYRIGFSILDLGSIKYKSNLRNIDLVNQDAYWADINASDINNLDQLFKTISYEFSGDSSQLVTEEAFSIWLPTAISMQADVRINKAVYLNATIVQPLIMSKAQVIRPPQLSVTPRWESDYFEIAMPFILYDYKYPRIGLSARFHKIVIGTDKIGSFFGINDFYGLDFYVLFKFSFLKGQCRNFDKKYGCGNLEYKQKY